jgi:CheY-like chemotaxis protein
VEVLGRELRSAQEAFLAERKRRAEENAQAKALAELADADARARGEREREHEEALRAMTAERDALASREQTRAIAESAAETARPPRSKAKGPDPKGSAVETPPEILRRELARALGGEGEAALAIDVMLAEAGSTTMPGGNQELLAFVERHLLAELRAHLGQAKSDALMDVLAAELARGAVPAGPPSKDSDRRRTVRPPTDHQRQTVRPPTGDHPSGAGRRTKRPPPAEEKPARGRTVPSGSAGERDARLAAGSIQRSVLVIDRDRVARADVSRALARAGCEITVRDSCAGIANAAHEFDVIVTEVVGVDIEELCEAFAGHPPPCAIIAWTAGIDGARTTLRGAGLGGVSVVRKESRPDALVAAVRAHLAERKAIARP